MQFAHVFPHPNFFVCIAVLTDRVDNNQTSFLRLQGVSMEKHLPLTCDSDNEMPGCVFFGNVTQIYGYLRKDGM